MKKYELGNKSELLFFHWVLFDLILINLNLLQTCRNVNQKYQCSILFV